MGKCRVDLADIVRGTYGTPHDNLLDVWWFCNEGFVHDDARAECTGLTWHEAVRNDGCSYCGVVASFEREPTEPLEEFERRVKAALEEMKTE